MIVVNFLSYGFCHRKISHPHFVIRLFPSAFYHPHFSIRILSPVLFHPHFSIRHPPSAIRHPPSAAIRSALYRDPKFFVAGDRVRAHCACSCVWPRLSRLRLSNTDPQSSQVKYSWKSTDWARGSSMTLEWRPACELWLKLLSLSLSSGLSR